AIEQKVNTRNPRSTVGTSTEIYDYLKLLFARIGKTYSPISGNLVKRDHVGDVVDFIDQLPEGTRVMLSAPLPEKPDQPWAQRLDVLRQQGFTRLLLDKAPHNLEDLQEPALKSASSIDLLIDRMVAQPGNEDNQSRIADSAQTAFYEGQGTCYVDVYADREPERHVFSNRFEADGMVFEEPSVHFFSFNNPLGACKTCEGFGSVIGIDEDLVVPNKGLSVYDDAIVCWKGEKMSTWKERLVLNSPKFDFPIHRPYAELTADQRALLWKGNRHFRGLNAFFKHLEDKSYKIQYRVMLSRYRGKTTCPDCKGTRLRKDASYVTVDGRSIHELVTTPVVKLQDFFAKLTLSTHDQTIARRLLLEINNRVRYLCDVGLGYLTLNRLSSSLSGGESQRINLSTSLGSSLVGSMYILDEPSIGLHPRDTQRLIGVLHSLKQLGNTLVVVEHDEDIMQAADQLIDLGPAAGSLGGELVFQGDHQALLSEGESLTARYLTGKDMIPIPAKRRPW
ncbi:MAG: excinuclease ABC subunit A, partial [Bacteroidota bacterium]